VHVPELATERLLLRSWREQDLEPFAALNADPVVMRCFPSTLTRAQSDAFVRDRAIPSFADGGFGPWAVERTDTGDFVGFVGLMRVNFEAAFTPAVEVGWRLARTHWGQGFAPEAARAGLRFGFHHAGLTEVVSFTSPLNRRSEAVMRRLGMRHDPLGDFDHPRLEPGSPLRRHVLYRLARADFDAGTGVGR
jgi:ribosomal-protein-alanine N-acetyltransferase